MQLDLTGAIEQIQRMGNAFLQRLPYIAAALVVFAAFYLPGVLGDPAPDVLLVGLAGSTVNLRVRWWIEPPRRSDALDSRDKILMAVKKTLSANGIDLPFETQVVLLHDQTEETDGDRRRQREGWPAGKGEVPRPLGLAAVLRSLPRDSGVEGGAQPPDGS
jgi:small conductance mechanosensitive channel